VTVIKKENKNHKTRSAGEWRGVRDVRAQTVFKIGNQVQV